MNDMGPKRRVRVRFLTRVCFIFIFAAFFLKLTPQPVQAKCYSGTVKCHCVCRAYDSHGIQISQKYNPGSRDVDTKHKNWYGGTCIPTKGADHALGLCTNSYSNDCKNLCEFWLKNNINQIPSRESTYFMQVKSGDKVKFIGPEVRERVIGVVSQ
jgi:hypothetical protein